MREIQPLDDPVERCVGQAKTAERIKVLFEADTFLAKGCGTLY